MLEPLQDHCYPPEDLDRRKKGKKHAIQHIIMLQSERYIKNKSQYNFQNTFLRVQYEDVYHYSLNYDSGARILPSI
jgi:hypothetical protein